MEKKKILYVSAILCVVQAAIGILCAVCRIAFPQNMSLITAATVCLFILSFVGAAAVLVYISKMTFRSFGTLALHFGMVFFFIGIGIYAISGDKYNVSMPVDKTASYSQIRVEDENGGYQTVVLPFEISLDSFERITHEDGTDKQYNGTLTFTEKLSRRAESVQISVNKPVRKNGYKIYLMGFSGTGDNVSVSMLMKRDPGEYISLIGIFCIILGSFICCFSSKKRQGISQEESGEGVKHNE